MAKSVIVFVSVGGKEYAATAGSRRPGADQRFRIGSVTKTFTATIVLQLVQEGMLRLDSTLEDHVPGVVPRGEEITIRHLLQHRSGLVNITDYPGWLNQAERSPSTSPINSLRFAASKPLVFKPGTRARYSNTNYIALGLVIEKVTGRSYAEELEQRILDPLGLDHTELPKTRRLPDLDRDRASVRTLLGPRRPHPRLRDARQRERGGRPCCRRLSPRWALDTYHPASAEHCSARSLRLPRTLHKRMRRSPSSALLAPPPPRSTS